MEHRKRQKWIGTKGAIALVLAAAMLAGVIVMSNASRFKASQKPISPFATVEFSIPRGKQTEFFDALHKFAEHKAFRYNIHESTNFPGTHEVDMLGKDLWILGQNYYDKDSFELGLYPVPGKITTSENIDKLVTELTSSVAELSGASAVTKK